MPNPKLNLPEIVAHFPGQIESKPGRPGFNLFTPFEVALRENQIALVQAELDLGLKIPAQYLLYAQGEPETREQSRIGGLPYRPRGLPWPLDELGRPSEFVSIFQIPGRLSPSFPERSCCCSLRRKVWVRSLWNGIRLA